MNCLVGNLHKMHTTLMTPASYRLRLDNNELTLNTLLQQKIHLRYLGEIHCTRCKRKTKKSYEQGHCYPCFQKLLSCHMCHIHPEKCRFYEGLCDPNDWAHAHCSQPHVVYLANSSALKVGITRESHIPSRWIDQGATQGLVIIKVKNRHQAGLVETLLKQYVNDRTQWQMMLKQINEDLALKQLSKELLAKAHLQLETLIERFGSEEIQILDEPNETRVEFPVLAYPSKVTKFDLDKTNEVEGVLHGIKGQYLIFDTGVINVRKYSGYRVELSWG